MIRSNFKNHQNLIIEGNIREVSAECVLIMKEIYKKNLKLYNKEIAAGILTNMLIRAIESVNDEEAKVEWRISEEEKMGYTE